MATSEASDSLREVKVHRTRRHTQVPGQLEAPRIEKVRNKSVPDFYGNQADSRQDFVYVNPGFVGSVNNVADNDDRPRQEPQTGVIYREQYWVCSKWPHSQKILAVAAGLLLGSVIGLIVTMLMSGKEGDILPGFLSKRSALE